MKNFKTLLLIISLFFLGCVGTDLNSTKVRPHNVAITPTVSDIVATAPLPSSYDLRDDIYIKVENQGTFGICYAFASLSSLETYLALNYGEYYDFSELHFSMSIYKQDGTYSSTNEALNGGGSFTNFFTYIQKDKSIALEEQLPISNYSNTTSGHIKLENDYDAMSDNFYPLIKVVDTVEFPKYAGDKSQYSATELSATRNKIKSHIMQYGSVTAGINSSDLNYSTKYYKITDDALLGDGSEKAINRNINHLISIVGWDDNYNANGAWDNPGAYLCLNSWGTDFGDNGYFYVSYDDYFIEYSINGITDAYIYSAPVQINTLNSYPTKTNIQVLSFTTSGGVENFVTAQVIDTSNYVGQSITSLDCFVLADSASFYIDFFSTYPTIGQINEVNVFRKKSASLQGNYSHYDKYDFSSPVIISNNYMVVVSTYTSATKVASMASNVEYGNDLYPTYCKYSSSSQFSSDKTWNTATDNQSIDYTIPIRLHTNKDYAHISEFDSIYQSFINTKYIKNNAIYQSKIINFTVSNMDNIDINSAKMINIKNNADYISHFSLSQNNASPNTISLTMNSGISASLPAGNYILAIPYQNGTLYRVVEVQDVVLYPINYHLNGGENNANNPEFYANNYTVLNVFSATKPGYKFMGWYTDSELQNEFINTELPKTELNLYAKWDFDAPSVLSKTKDINIVYYNNLGKTLSVEAYHALQSELNTLSYQWYYKKSAQDTYSLIDSATSSSLTVHTVADSGYYACEITITITDPSITAEPIVRALSPCAQNEIFVDIQKFVYDMSNVAWTYTEPLFYNGASQTVTVGGLPEGIEVSYSNNSFAQIGSYIATAEISYDDMDGNAYAKPIDDLSWSIRPAKIVVDIDDITTEQEIELNTSTLASYCNITGEYFPDDIVSLEDKIEYLSLEFNIIGTSYNFLKIISATTDSFEIHDITINSGEYRVIVKNLLDNNVSAYNESGFLKDCEFSAMQVDINSIDNIDLIVSNHLVVADAYQISYSYLDQDDVYTINIPLSKNQLFNDIDVYYIKDGELVKITDAKVSTGGIKFSCNIQNATFIIAQKDNSTFTLKDAITLSISGGGIIILFFILLPIRRKNNDFY